MSDALVFRHISKQFVTPGGSVEALRGLSLAVPAGRFTAIVGPSGCGKSTLLHIAAGLDTQFEGEFRLAADGNHVAYVFQTPRLLPWLTTVQNVRFVLDAHGQGRREAQAVAQRYVDLVGLGGFEDRFPAQLSGGMQQRVALARALAIEPDVMLMDEPFAALDELTAQRIRAELLLLYDAAPRTVLFVTHNVTEAAFLADRVVVMSPRPGRVVAEIAVDLPRPRDYNDPAVAAIAREIVSHLELSRSSPQEVAMREVQDRSRAQQAAPLQATRCRGAACCALGADPQRFRQRSLRRQGADFAILTALLTLPLAACGAGTPAAAPSKPAAAAAPAAPPARLRPLRRRGGKLPRHRAAPVVLRWSTIENANQAYIPILLRDKGIGAKYGLDVQITPISNTGQQWNSMRAGEADISSGSVLDLLRQRQAGLQAKAVRNWATFSNPVVAMADKPYAKLSDLRGARVGTPTDTLLDWMILRAAGARAEGFDLSKDAQVQNAAPGLLNGLLDKGDLDAALQFSDFTLAPVSQGKYKEVTTVPKAMVAGRLDPESLYLTYNVADAWRTKNPEAMPRLVAAIEEAMRLMQTDDAIWPELAKRSGVEDPAMLQPYVRMQRESSKTVWGPEKLAPTQAVLDALNETVGASPVGVTRADPAAFDFDAAEAAKRLR